MKKLKTFAVSVIAASLGLLIYCGGFYIKSYEQNLAAKQGYEEIADIAATSDGEKIPKIEKKDGSSSKEKSKSEKKRNKKNQKDTDKADKIRESFGISWENLRKINSQVAAWITIPGADISYPVVQGTDDEYYLRHNFKKEEDLFGCIFLHPLIFGVIRRFPDTM